LMRVWVFDFTHSLKSILDRFLAQRATVAALSSVQRGMKCSGDESLISFIH